MHEFDKMVLKRFWREIIIVILVVAVAISVRTCHTHADNEQTALNINDSAFTVIKKHELKNGQMASQIQTHELTIQQLKQNISALGIDKNSLTSQVGNLKRLVGYWQTKAQVKDTFSTVLRDTVYVDLDGSHKGKEFDWKNKYMHMTGFIQQDFHMINIGYIYDVDFDLTAYRKKKPLTDYFKFNFKPGVLVSDVTFSDPNMKTTAFKGMVVKEDKKPFIKSDGAKILGGGLAALILRGLIVK